MSMVTSFTVVPNWKQPNVPSVGKWIKKKCDTYNAMLFNAKKKCGIKP